MYKNSKFTIILPLVIACSIVAGILLGNRFVLRGPGGHKAGMSSRIAPGGDKINALMNLIATRYVDPISLDSLTEIAIPQILADLDPHSVYVPAKEMSSANEALDGEFDGIGVVFNMATDTVIVLNVITGGPSDKAGIQGRDRIVTVNDSIVAGVKMDQEKVVKMLRGPRSSTVRLGVKRLGIEEIIPITVTRGIIPIKSISAAYMREPGIGYIKFDRFSRNTYVELMEAVTRLQAEGMQKLILDIRGNSGGFLDQAIMISNEFLPDKKLIVYTKDRTGKETKQFSNGKGLLSAMPLALLVDEGSASSSEILAGALQDNDRGTLIGRRTYGKGLVQDQVAFQDGSAVRLTIAHYYTPTGRSIQKPYAKGKDDYFGEVYTRFQHNEMFSADSIHFADSLKYHTESGKAVYGGGGIMPDIFMPMDTADVTKYFREVSGRNILYRFTIDYSDKRRAELRAIKTLPELDAFFKKDPNLLSAFVQYATKEGVPANQAEISRSKAILLAQLRAYIGRNTSLEDNAFLYEIQNIDNVIDKAVEVLK